MTELPGTREILKADLVLLAMGFLYPVVDKLVPGFDLHLDKRGNIKTDTGNRTSHPKIFAAGDARSGASLVVHAIYSGRQAAVNIHQFLQEQE
jgi:glutamate synthase (NADPH/NADH) small chain